MITYNIFNGTFGLIFFLFVLIMLVPTVFYLSAMQQALEAVSVENRKMKPAQVWLSLIPLFNFVWMFFVVNKIAESFRDECAILNIPTTETNPTQGIGTTKNVLRICSMVPLIGFLAGLGFIVCWIMHWAKVNEYRKLILANKDNLVLEAEKGIFHH